MNDRQRILNILNYENYDRVPVLHFGFIYETLQKWVQEGHLTAEEVQATSSGDGFPGENAIAGKLGFDANYYRSFQPHSRISPAFESKVIEELPDGYRKILTGTGAIILWNERNVSIPAEVDHILKGRKEWDEIFLQRLQFSPERVDNAAVNCDGVVKSFADGGKEYLTADNRDDHYLLHCGSLYGALRDYVGIENLCYLIADDEDLLDEMIEVNADLCYRNTEYALQSGAKFDIGHFWEDICYKNGPLINPKVFAEKVGPHYKRITDLLHRYGIDLVSLDCDGMIDLLIPTWLDNGVNVMFPIEVGTWNASIAPWREKYGKQIRGVGGMDKRVFGKNFDAVDAEIERLKPLVGMGGFIPCMDHRIPPDAVWENIQYYCDKFRSAFGG
ncbi:MAG: uroporphyrinogen decarboxylase family protein [Armatimonadota bacterium]